MKLKTTCSNCGRTIPYMATCPCLAESKKETRKRYDELGRDKQSASVYRSKEWTLIRQVVIERDNGLCRICLSEKRIQPADMVHHIVELSEDRSKAYEVGNLISLCNSCHADTHSRYAVDKKMEQSRLVKLVLNRGGG